MSADEQRKLAAIMFTDMVGYSALSQRDEKLAQELLEEHRQLLREIFPRFNGSEIKTIGDAFLVEFNSALEAAQCAIEIQRALVKRNADVPPDRRIEIKIGIHIGDVVHRGGDVYGDGVNIASRIEPLAGAGGICVSMDVERQLRNAVETRFEKLAPTELKNISVPMELFRIVLPWERQLPFPPSKPMISSAPPRPWIWAAAAAALLLILGMGWWWTSRKPQPAREQPVSRANDLTANIPEKSIAVLPFENLSEDKSNAFFADGVQDEILTDLAKVADLKVISRTSVLQYRDKAARNLREIAQQLGVAHVLEGSVQRAAAKIRVNAQLIDARNDAHLWAQTYDRDLADVFAIQSEIAKTIAEQLQAKLSPKEEAVVEAKPTKDLVAYDLYLRALEIDRNRVSSIGTGGAEGAKREVELLDQAVSRDPEFVPALCRLANTHLYLFWLNDRSAAHVDLAKKALEAAARLQPDAGEVHFTRGLLYYRGSLDYEPALAEFALAERSSPNDAYAPFLIGMVKRRQGRWDESIQHIQQSLALDPHNAALIPELATTYMIVRRYDEASKTLDSTLAWKPVDFSIALLHAWVDMAWKADLSRWKAVVAGEAGAPAYPNDLISARLALALFERNYRAAQEALDTPGLAEFDDNGFFFPREWTHGIIARGLGDKARANTEFLAARQRAATAAQESPEDARALIVLGQIDVALGRAADAVREGERAVELLPPSKDAVNGRFIQEKLGRIYAQAGDANRAINFLQRVSTAPNGPTYGSLKLEADWDPLRGDPRFEKIVASLAPK
ncbi:MAG: FlgO family outer membrane protein [Chthoniobacterales bacterium]